MLRTIAYKGQQNLIQLRDYYSADLGKEGFTCYMALVNVLSIHLSFSIINILQYGATTK